MAEKQISYLALGDSYTIGEKVILKSTFPKQLQAYLNGNGFKVKSPKIIAKTGWRTDELLDAVQKKLSSEKKYDLVSLLIGVNNQYQGKPFQHFKKEFTQLLEIATERSRKGKSRVFVLSIPDYSVTPFGQKKSPKKTSAEIKKYNEAARKVCQNFGVNFYNITTISERAENESKLIASDGLHPSAEMYQLWVEKIGKKVIQQINSGL